MTNHSGDGTPSLMRRKALEHWRSFSQRLKYRVVVLERELSAAQSALAEKEREVERVERDKQAYRGALGYSVSGAFNGRTSDGTIPICGLCEANHKRAESAEVRAEEAEKDAERYRLCQQKGFPVRNQTAHNEDHLWTIQGNWFGATPSLCIDAALEAAPPALASPMSPTGRKE